MYIQIIRLINISLQFNLLVDGFSKFICEYEHYMNVSV